MKYENMKKTHRPRRRSEKPSLLPGCISERGWDPGGWERVEDPGSGKCETWMRLVFLNGGFRARKGRALFVVRLLRSSTPFSSSTLVLGAQLHRCCFLPLQPRPCCCCLREYQVADPACLYNSAIMRYCYQSFLALRLWWCFGVLLEWRFWGMCFLLAGVIENISVVCVFFFLLLCLLMGFWFLCDDPDTEESPLGFRVSMSFCY